MCAIVRLCGRFPLAPQEGRRVSLLSLLFAVSTISRVRISLHKLWLFVRYVTTLYLHTSPMLWYHSYAFATSRDPTTSSLSPRTWETRLRLCQVLSPQRCSHTSNSLDGCCSEKIGSKRTNTIQPNVYDAHASRSPRLVLWCIG